MNLRLKDKNAIITGGGSGIGAAICKRFASEGANLTILDRDVNSGQEIADSIGGRFIRCDVADEQSVAGAFSQLDDLSPDILVNNAGIAHVGDLATTCPEDFDRVMRVNVRGPYLCSRAALPSMLEKGNGCILNLASVAAQVGIADRFAYSTSKGAVYTMTLSIARDYVKRGIRANCLCPARVHTPFVDNYLRENYPGEEAAMFSKLEATQPIGRMAKPDEIAALATYICSEEAAFVTGAAFDIDGGFTLLK
ncbi:MAG: SDR family oxidoreductase [Verrucomicrobiaceae bacterium]|nr:SDR family oxidoreductase [Verrucomicrobiaceae bacterium]